MANSNDPGYLAYQQSLQESGFLVNVDKDGNTSAPVTAQDVRVGRKH
jgi:hypothetical protein